MDKFLNKIREAELEPNQNNAFLKEIFSTTSGQKTSKNGDVKKILYNKSYLLFRFFHCGCHKIYSIVRGMWQKAIQQCCGAKQT